MSRKLWGRLHEREDGTYKAVRIGSLSSADASWNWRVTEFFVDDPAIASSPAAPEPVLASEDTARLDWIERNVCNVDRLGDSARTLRISWNNGADRVFVGPGYSATWRDAIDSARASVPAAGEPKKA